MIKNITYISSGVVILIDSIIIRITINIAKLGAKSSDVF